MFEEVNKKFEVSFWNEYTLTMDGYLVLEDKTILQGQFFGFPKETAGEVVFTTGMVGYPEALTDPSFKGQIIVFTYPLIGNYGVPSLTYKDKIRQNFESHKIHAMGAIVTYQSNSTSHWLAKTSFTDWMRKNKIPGLAGVDTRALTQKLRQKGTMLGRLTLKKNLRKKLKFYDPNKDNLVAEVSCQKPIIHRQGKKRILLIDCGVKDSIIRNLIQLKATVIQVPWDFDPLKNKIEFDAVVVSNGPGDPMKVKKTINTVKKILAKNIPFLGVGLGNQILALAAGGKTYKMKYGHRSQNQPCLLAGSEKAFITSQNHGFAVKTNSLPRGWKEWLVNLNDNTNEGIIHQRKPFCSVQFLPEANPGKWGTQFIFEKFLSWL